MGQSAAGAELAGWLAGHFTLLAARLLALSWLHHAGWLAGQSYP